jgi:uncharacterized membrane protein
METMMNSPGYRGGVTAGIAIVLLMTVISIFAGMVLPEGRYPIHWNAHGKVDGYGSRAQILMLVPGISALVLVLLAVYPWFEPRGEHIRQSMRAYMTICVGALGFLLALHLTLVLVAFGVKLDVSRVIGVLMGLLLAGIGNYLGKLRSNYFAGVRTPWTLSSELSWNKTNRLCGKLLVLFGILLILAALFAPPVAIFAVIMIMVVTLVTVTFGYSYVVWKQDPARRA